MNKQALLKLLKNPAEISETDLKGLEKMVESYPYFQAAHVLLAKTAKDSGEMHADKKIRKAAVYVGERKILKRLLADKNLTEEKETGMMLTGVNELQADEKENEPEKQKVIEVEKAELLREQTVKVQEERERKSRNEKFFNELQNNLKRLREMRAKLAAGIPLDEKEKTEGTLESAYDFKTERRSKELIPEKIKEHREEEEIFTSRLDEVITDKKDRYRAIDESELLLNYLSFLEMNKNTAKDKKSADEIIERFIREEPSIPKLHPGNLPEEQEDKASESYQLRENPASENMAKILLLQGKREKAVEIYKQLILKYPEKKAYFASQIEKINPKQ
jgi:tetratricopeptide (TPR) repeat protein